MLLRVRYQFSDDVLKAMAIDNIPGGAGPKSIDFDLDEDDDLRQFLAVYNPKISTPAGEEYFNEVFGMTKLFMSIYNNKKLLVVDTPFSYDIKATIRCLLMADLIANEQNKGLKKLEIEYEKNSQLLKKALPLLGVFILLFLITFFSAIFYVNHSV